MQEMPAIGSLQAPLRGINEIDSVEHYQEFNRTREDLRLQWKVDGVVRIDKESVL